MAVPAVIALLLVGSALAGRPTEGGLYAFDPSDDVTSSEASGVRVHYSVSGPSVIPLDDDDASGVPDYAELVLDVALASLELYDGLGLLPPLRESEVGLGPLGGSDALDFYLVDFGGVGDGHFAFDGCEGQRCAGYMAVENDFAGYGYPNRASALGIVVPHELFHGVQAAYNAELPQWVSEGTATWAVKQYHPDTWDFLAFADAYLADPGRPIDKPPTGPVPSFAYGTALWFDFLTTRHDAGLMDELLVAMEGTVDDDAFTLDMEAAIEARGDSLAEAWPTFASWNLAAGNRSGAAEGYRYALRLDGIQAELEGGFIDDENRFYPLAATYYRLDHGGGPLSFAIDDDAPGLAFALHPVVEGRSDGPVEDAVATWANPVAGSVVVVEDAPAGGYWLVGSFAAIADGSQRVRVCLGGAEDVAGCAPEVVEAPAACGCEASGGGGRSLWMALSWLVMARRRGGNRNAARGASYRANQHQHHRHTVSS